MDVGVDFNEEGLVVLSDANTNVMDCFIKLVKFHPTYYQIRIISRKVLCQGLVVCFDIFYE